MHEDSRSTKIRIAGAGLAGLAAAVILGEGGREVEVFEKKAHLLPSSGAHTEGVRNYRSMDALEELAATGLRLSPFSTVQHTIRVSPSYRNELLGPAHYLFLRGVEPSTVDQVLYRQARVAGVQFHFGTALADGEADIVATGPPKDRTSILGAGYTFSARGSRFARDSAYALFDNNVAPAGYLALTPGAEYHSVYSVSWKEFRYDALLARLQHALDLPWIRDLLVTSERVGRIHGRAYFTEDPISGAEQGGTLFVGEAGGFQDAVAGFGFRYAVMTGALAARSILTGMDYRELLRAAFGTEFQDAYAFRDQWNQATNADYDKFVLSLGPKVTLEEYLRLRGPRGF